MKRDRKNLAIGIPAARGYVPLKAAEFTKRGIIPVYRRRTPKSSIAMSPTIPNYQRPFNFMDDVISIT
jgi:hypothetical protein